MESIRERFHCCGFALEVPKEFIADTLLIIPLRKSQSVNIVCYSVSEFPKYVFNIVDSVTNSGLAPCTAAVFIIPQGQERSWTFSTQEGLLELLDQISVSRVIYITLGRGFVFPNLVSVQEELKTLVLNFLPPKCASSKVSFMTNGDIGEKSLIFASNGIIVEDIKEGDWWLRQMIFVSNTNQIQSEVRIEFDEAWESGLITYNKSEVKINYDFLSCEFQRCLLLALAFYPERALRNELKVLFLGAGACVMPTFLVKHFLNIEVTAVDIDSEVVQIGHNYFAVPSSPRLTVIIEDAVSYVNNYSGPRFDIVFLDISIAEKDVPTPPPQFTCSSFTAAVREIINEQGLFVVNVIGTDSQVVKIIDDVQVNFKNIYKGKCKEDINQLLYCVKEEKEFDWKNIVKGVCEMEAVKGWDQTMAIVEYAEWVKKVQGRRMAEDLLRGKRTNKKNKKSRRKNN